VGRVFCRSYSFLFVPICSYLFLAVPICFYSFLSVPIRSYPFLSVPIRSYVFLAVPYPFLIGWVGGGGGGSFMLVVYWRCSFKCVKIVLMGLKLTKEIWDGWALENKIRFFKFEEFVKEEGGFIDSDLVLKMERLRDYCGFPLIVTSGFRSPEKNEGVGGALHSFHLKGEAVDVSIKGFSPSMLYRLVKGAFWVGFGGIFVYPAHVHLDIRGVEIFKVEDYNKKGKT
jgi:hypothetical protein